MDIFYEYFPKIYLACALKKEVFTVDNEFLNYNDVLNFNPDYAPYNNDDFIKNNQDLEGIALYAWENIYLGQNLILELLKTTDYLKNYSSFLVIRKTFYFKRENYYKFSNKKLEEKMLEFHIRKEFQSEWENDFPKDLFYCKDKFINFDIYKDEVELSFKGIIETKHLSSAEILKYGKETFYLANHLKNKEFFNFILSLKPIYYRDYCPNSFTAYHLFPKNLMEEIIKLGGIWRFSFGYEQYGFVLLGKNLELLYLELLDKLKRYRYYE